MKKILPYLFLITLAIPQFNWIGKCAGFVEPEKAISLFLAEEIDDFAEEDTNENSESGGSKSESEKELESKKLFLSHSLSPQVWVNSSSYDKFFSRYINHYDFSFSTITLPPPELS